VTSDLGVLPSSAVVPGSAARLLPNDPTTGPRLADHLARHGALPQRLGSADRRGAVVDEIARSGLVGHGGAAFPTARKLTAVRSQRRRAVVIANGTEGEPASWKDRVLLARAPHMVLDGASVAADLVGAREAIVVVHGDVREAVDDAVDERRKARLDRACMRVVTASDRFVGGEASAVVTWVARGRAVPSAKPPRTAERGLHGRPTLVQNVETLAQLALIVRHGADWYRAIGTPNEPGTMLVTLSGALARPGVSEVAIGTPVADLVALAGGTTSPLQAFLIGGYFGTWVPADATLTRPFSAQGLRTGLGAGLVLALSEQVCGVAEVARLVRYLAAESAGQCGPCVFGLPAIAGELEKLAEGRLSGLGHLERWLLDVDGRGACSHPDGVSHQVASALTVFAREVACHLGGSCTVDPSRGVASIPQRASR
jgi:NADH:ubiquinone oxidoreductase subunit F (NADH-binding)